MKPDDQDRKIDELLSRTMRRDEPVFDFDKWKQNHAKEIRTYQSQAAGTPSRVRRPEILATIVKDRFFKFAVAAVIILAAVLTIQNLTGPMNLAAPAWADVAKSFNSVPFFSAAIYVKDEATAEPKQIELWMSRDGRTRLRTGSQVIFGRGGKVIRAFDIKSRTQVEPDERAGFLLEKLGAAEEFSLDSVIKVMFGAELEDVTPLINPHAVISEDLVVFDVQSTISPEWLRIWALRESRLPIRIRVWDPRDGDATDVVFTYSKEQPEQFFDPNAFADLLKRRQSSRVQIAYAYLKDPGGRHISPEDIFAESGYHLPEIDQVGITPDGAVWVIAKKGRNETPRGRTFYGFSRLKDDLGREYKRVYYSHHTATDVSTDVFLTLDYPFDKRTPGRLTLLCAIDDYDPQREPELIGAVELTEWKQGQLWPQGDEASLKTTLAWHLLHRRDYDRLERIMDTIEGKPEDSPLALKRERIRMSMLIIQNRFDEAVELGRRLLPLLEQDYQRWKGHTPNPSVFTDYLLALACTNRVEEAGQVWARVIAITPEIPDSLSKRARRQIEENIQNSFENACHIVVPHLSRKAHMTVEQINDMLGIDIKNNEAFRNYSYWDWNPEFEKPKYRNWEKHLAELAEHYKTHPLPETMEILEDSHKQDYGVHTVKMPGIETHSATRLRDRLRDYARSYNYPESVGRIRIEADIADAELNHDLIYKSDISASDRIRFILNHFGLEVVEVNEPRTVWIARHDGRELKDCNEVRAPVPYDGSGKRKAGMMTSMARPGFNLEYLFREFMHDQDKDARADRILIIDQTGIKGSVSLEGPCFEGPEAIDIARKWFADEFGITFTEQARTMTTYVIRKKTEPAK
jgi:hypothetical protein